MFPSWHVVFSANTSYVLPTGSEKVQKNTNKHKHPHHLPNPNTHKAKNKNTKYNQNKNPQKKTKHWKYTQAKVKRCGKVERPGYLLSHE